MSNLVAECTPEEAFSTVGDHIVFASGSPFHDVNLGMCCNLSSYVLFVWLGVTRLFLMERNA